jgi:hypothetical protein
MTTQNKTKDAKTNGGEIKKPVGKSNPAVGADEIEIQLERILARVPPLLTLPKPKTRCP